MALRRIKCRHPWGPQGMTDYRFYCLDSIGHIGSGEWFDANSDDEAMTILRVKKLSVRCELWDRNRLVGTILPVGAPLQSS
jgi:hypothetical protein